MNTAGKTNGGNTATMTTSEVKNDASDWFTACSELARLESTVSISLLKRLRIRPVGVVSSHRMVLRGTKGCKVSNSDERSGNNTYRTNNRL